MTLAEAKAVNTAAKAMRLGLAGMTQQRWDAYTEAERDGLRDLSGLNPQLLMWEGYRVEVVDDYGNQRRFWVGRSSGWRPCHLEIKRRDSYGGTSADWHYHSVRPVGNGRRTDI